MSRKTTKQPRIDLDQSAVGQDGGPPPLQKRRGRPRGRAKCKPERRYLVPKVKYTRGITITLDEDHVERMWSSDGAVVKRRGET